MGNQLDHVEDEDHNESNHSDSDPRPNSLIGKFCFYFDFLLFYVKKKRKKAALYLIIILILTRPWRFSLTTIIETFVTLAQVVIVLSVMFLPLPITIHILVHIFSSESPWVKYRKMRNSQFLAIAVISFLLSVVPSSIMTVFGIIPVSKFMVFIFFYPLGVLGLSGFTYSAAKLEQGKGTLSIASDIKSMIK